MPHVPCLKVYRGNPWRGELASWTTQLVSRNATDRFKHDCSWVIPSRKTPHGTPITRSGMIMQARQDGNVSGCHFASTMSASSLRSWPLRHLSSAPLRSTYGPWREFLERDWEGSFSITSGALGPTIQSSMANHSLQLRSAASISASPGPCSGRRNGTVSRGSMS